MRRLDFLVSRPGFGGRGSAVLLALSGRDLIQSVAGARGRVIVNSVFF